MTPHRCSIAVVGYCEPGTAKAAERHGDAKCTGHSVSGCHLAAVVRVTDLFDDWPQSYACRHHIDDIAATRSQPVIAPLPDYQDLLAGLIHLHLSRQTDHEACGICTAYVRDYPNSWRLARANQLTGDDQS